MQVYLSRCCKLVFFSTFLSLIFTFTSTNTLAWNAVGHMVVANIAYQHLSAQARSNVDSIAANFVKEYPEMRTFLDLSYWPDAIRSQHINTYTHWHFIDIPFTNDESKLVDTVQPENVVWAIQNVQAVVKNFRANSFERMRFLSFLVHFVGDVHQPLHTATCISAQHPNGDKGGNLYSVYFNGRSIKLHALWDEGLGEFAVIPSQENVVMIANRIIKSHPASDFGNRINDLDPLSWAKEGVALAQKEVYQLPEGKNATAEYVENGRKRIEEQAALAGYRLAQMLNLILGVKTR